MTRPTILPPGSYFIKNDGTGQFIGQVKSALLGTKPIQSISEQPSLAWEIDQLDNGNYTIKVNGLPVVAIKSNLSVLINPTAHLEWRIVPRNTLNSGYLAAYT
ncbi:hypothetical protein H0H81_012553 [Sphagnurus paluster]|uniref:Uncharacterized protein n=1 Tax=Sphagnurus paluster TaxID=117069 RepID=A0A9P7GHY2_9AGAR|nr:hypothetical protein H0H81_012553 [Sphagnurus paluster]